MTSSWYINTLWCCASQSTFLQFTFFDPHKHYTSYYIHILGLIISDMVLIGRQTASSYKLHCRISIHSYLWSLGVETRIVVHSEHAFIYVEITFLWYAILLNYSFSATRTAGLSNKGAVFRNSAEAKWQSFCIRHFHMCYLERTFL